MRELCIKAFVSGKVQGVFYRQSTKQQAETHQLYGYAKNLADGRVEVVLQGDEQNVRLVTDWLHLGPQQARVESVDWQQIEPMRLDGFETY
ncbi:acylphosphatase [Neptunicella marina]|uniref:acylphosphatase n=1 Tax=Neptunicella marina TaxID=2125989 RepID=A0A8J6M3C2_9ALTE|nr:acylphosphatase [Neptunicella marina]MBC3767333.1 acylphosphatase [Neptunicella marina]